MILKNLTIALSILLLMSCGDGGSSTNKGTGKNSEKKYQLPSGYAQHGPCKAEDSYVKVTPLDPTNLSEVDAGIFETSIENDRGYYDLSDYSTEYRYSKIYIEAHCKDENRNVYMRMHSFLALYDASSDTTSYDASTDTYEYVGKKVNVNPGSTITLERIIKLYNDASSDYYQNFDMAEKQATKELMAVFNIHDADENITFTSTSLEDGDEAAAMLLAINVVLLDQLIINSNTFTRAIIEDLRDHGKLITEKYIEQLKIASWTKDLFTIKENFKLMYAELGMDVVVPPFWKYIDSHNNGILNKDDPLSAGIMDLISREDGDIREVIYNHNMDQPYGEDVTRHNTFPFVAKKWILDETITANFIITDLNTSKVYNGGDPYIVIHDNDLGNDGIVSGDDKPGTPLLTTYKLPKSSVKAFMEDYLPNEQKYDGNFMGWLNNYTFSSGKYWLVLQNADAYNNNLNNCFLGDENEDSTVNTTFRSRDGINWEFGYGGHWNTRVILTN